jgi:hypothetical protein
MPSFTIEGREYELLTLDQLPDMELGDLEILEDAGGLNVGALEDPEGVPVTVKLVIALVYISMLKSNPSATLEQARRAKIGVLEALAEQVASDGGNGNGAGPPTGRVGSGRPRSKKHSASSRGT